jgi:hypothetical protein
LGFSNWPVIYYTFPRQLGCRSFYRRCRVLKKKLSHHHHRAIRGLEHNQKTAGGSSAGSRWIHRGFLQEGMAGDQANNYGSGTETLCGGRTQLWETESGADNPNSQEVGRIGDWRL